MENKCCTKCKVKKPFVDYYKDKANKYGYKSICKKCMGATSKQWVKTNPEQYKYNIKKWRNNISAVNGIYDNDLCLYVGKSFRVTKRIAEHKSNIESTTNTPQKELYEQLSQHIHLIFGIIEECDNHKEREDYWIRRLNPKYNMYS